MADAPDGIQQLNDGQTVIQKNDNDGSMFKLFAANANSIKNKIDSLKFNISKIDPEVIVIQEAKLKRASQITLSGYKCFVTIRGDNGGGLLIACKNQLNPVLIHSGG